MAEAVTIFEVGPRDGLQNEARMIPAGEKIRLVDLLSAAGLQKIEVTSFVSPKWVPQMADAPDVLAGIRRQPGVIYSALTPNEKGYERAKAADVDEVAIFASASEGFSQKNINCSIEQSLARFAPIMARAADDGLPVRGYVSCVTDCPYDGEIAPKQVAKVAARLATLGCYEISLGDTIGAATPERIAAMLNVVAGEVPADRLAGHFHDTEGRALENVDVALAADVRVFDSAVGGLGGCPYAPGASGNVATEAVVSHLEARGFVTGVDQAALAVAVGFAKALREAKP